MSFADQHYRDDRERDGQNRTQVVERRTHASGRPAGSVALLDHVDGEIVEQRSLRTVDFSAATMNSVLGLLLLALEGVVGTRFLLRMFGANPRSGFVDFMYDLSWPFVRPFSNAFANHRWDQGIIEPGSLMAMFIYAVIAGLLMLTITTLLPVYRERRAVTSRRTTSI